MRIIKLIFIIIIVMNCVLCANFTSSPRKKRWSPLEDTLFRYLDTDLRNNIQNTDAFGFVLDPYVEEQKELNYHSKYIMFDIFLYDLHLDGLSKYKVVQTDVSLFPPMSKMKLRFPKLNFNAYYKYNGDAIGMIPMYGEGDLTAIVNDFYIEIVGGLDLFPLKLTSFKFDFDLGKFKMNVTGFYYDDDISYFLSHVISEMTPKFIRNYYNEIKNMIELEIEKTLK